MKIKEYSEVFGRKIFVGRVNLDWGFLMGLGSVKNIYNLIKYIFSKFENYRKFQER